VHLWETKEPFRSVGTLPHSHGSVYSLSLTKEYLILGMYALRYEQPARERERQNMVFDL